MKEFIKKLQKKIPNDQGNVFQYRIPTFHLISQIKKMKEK